ncbi:MAG: ATP-binding protein [Bacteroidales bacterium]|jgi:two-component system sensor histidine kinase/response regulator
MSGLLKKQRKPRLEIFLFLIIAVLGVIYVHYTWVKFDKDKSEQVLQIARSIEASLPITDLTALEAKPDDINKPEYQSIKKILKKIIGVNPKASFAYLYAQKDDKIYFIADSEPEESEDYSPPGQEYTEAQPQDRQPFSDGKELVTPPLTDRWGTWISVYIPVKDESSGNIIAVFGMDFNAKSWDTLLFFTVFKSSLIILLLLLTCYFLIRIIAKNRRLNHEMAIRKQVDEALFASETRMRSITDSAHDAIIMMDDKGLISYWNPAAERIFGYSSGEAIGQNLHELIVPAHYRDLQSKVFPVFVETGMGAAVGKTLDLEGLRKDGTEFSVQLSLSTIQIDGKWNAVGILRDTTVQKKTEAALVKAKQESEAANKAKSLFLSNMSHEIRTPLNAIIGFSQLMNRDKLLTDAQKDYNNSIIRAGEHLLELINEILELSKIEAGRVVLNPTNIDLHILFNDIYMLFKERAQYKHLQLIFENADDLPQFVIIDESKLRQLFVNIIGNALKFTDEGGIAVRTRVDRIDNETSVLIVEVQDSGPGIPEDEIGRLFRHFEQTSSGVKKGSGTGLGLALSRELALLMGGDITVSSQVGVGSVFTFQVVIKNGKAEDIEKSNTKRVICIDKSEDVYRILVVDDKKENLQVAVDLLKLVGFETFEAVDGEDAIEKFKECDPHLILMDMRMPVMDGYEATSRIKSMEKGKHTPIVALTASTFEEERNRIKALDMQGYIRKPFRESDLFNTIGKILNIKYIYEDDVILSTEDPYELTDKSGDRSINLPDGLVSDMLNAISVADLDQLIKLIGTIEQDNPQFAHQLMVLAKNYDYDHLEKLLNDTGGK